MIILGIDTSCDDTSIAIIKANKRFKILSNIISSQVKIHRKYGGVYPSLAKREHQKNLAPVLKKALTKAKLSKSKIDLIAVTKEPGLEPCLWVGKNFAKELSYAWDLPIVSVNHIESHILANFLNTKYKIQNTKYLFPAICLVVSGGHTQLMLMKKIGKYKILGETRDDAAGECLDKTARILGLEYPGGPMIEKLASQIFRGSTSEDLIRLPRPMIHSKDYDFSFSGLKTAVLYNHKKYIQAMCAEIQQAVIDVLIHKTLKAAKNYSAKAIILGGGVAANKELRKQFISKLKITNYKLKFLVPPKILCTDNAAMVALTGYYRWKKTI